MIGAFLGDGREALTILADARTARAKALELESNPRLKCTSQPSVIKKKNPCSSSVLERITVTDGLHDSVTTSRKQQRRYLSYWLISSLEPAAGCSGAGEQSGGGEWEGETRDETVPPPQVLTVAASPGAAGRAESTGLPCAGTGSWEPLPRFSTRRLGRPPAERSGPPEWTRFATPATPLAVCGWR
ncbi:unnamed protein product [Lampetra fluviatilis]